MKWSTTPLLIFMTAFFMRWLELLEKMIMGSRPPTGLFGLRSDYGVPQSQTYIYTDRPIYRPGQTVYYRLVHRDVEDGEYKLPVEDEITLRVDLPSGEDQEVSLPLSVYGTAHGEYQLSSFAERVPVTHCSRA